VENRPGGGAVFKLELPGAPSPFANDAKPYVNRPPRTEGQASQGSVGSKLILVVEDEPTVARLIADVLSEDGHVVEIILDSREGLERVRARRYDLVICDLRMPHLDGRAFYRQLMRDENPLQHRLIFVTGDTVAPRTVDFLQRCGLPYLAKPFLVEELKQVVGRTLEQTSDVGGTSPGDTQRKAEGGYERGNERHWKQHEI